MNSKKNKVIFDVAVIGAGPVGIAFACSFAKTNMKIAIIEKQPKKILANPNIDGREIALTHLSANILKELNVWQSIPAKLITIIKTKNLLNGVVSGIGGYGNCMGIPTVGGEVKFDTSYNENISK